MARNDARDKAPKTIDLEKVARLIDALERDLAKVQSGSRDVQLLRDEVETLKNVLNSPIRRPHWVREGQIENVLAGVHVVPQQLAVARPALDLQLFGVE